MATSKEENMEIDGKITMLPKVDNYVSWAPDRESSTSSSSNLEDHKIQRRSTRISELDLKQEQERQERELAKRKLQQEDMNNGSLNEEEEYDEELNQINNELHSNNGWNEPPLAKPTPIVTGLPLGSFPSKKIRKEALWPRKKTGPKKTPGRKKANHNLPRREENNDDNNNNNSADKSTIVANLESDEDMDSQQNEPAKEFYDRNLKTNLSEPLTQYSIERVNDHFKLVPIQKKGSDQFLKKKIVHSNGAGGNHTHNHDKPTSAADSVDQTPVPSTPHKASGKVKHENGNKRIKRTPKKNRGNAFGYGASDLSGRKRGGYEYDDPTRDNEDFCSACGGAGIFLCCEACPKSFHFICCDPPMDEDSLPEGNWYCNECLSKRRKVRKYNVGIFSKLLNQCEIRNPRKFQLPKKLRESTFENVSTGPTGEYQDASFIKHSRPIKVGKLEEMDPLNIYEKDGKPLLCYNCGLSGLEKQITKCGYCNLAWHLDCVTPPLPSVKTMGTKWKCPNHVSDLIPNKKRRYKKQNYVDVSMSRGFKNDGDVEIIPESDIENGGEDDEDDFLEGETEIVQLVTPSYFNTYYDKGEVHAPVGEELEKIITMNNVTYRIPERGVILDFIDSSKVKKLKEVQEIVRGNSEILKKLDTDSDQSKKLVIESMSSLHDKPLVVHHNNGLDHGNDTNLTFKYLLSVVDDELNKEVGSEEKEKEMDPTSLSVDEMKELMHLKKLIDCKGRDKLLSFLQTI